jgi:hypothetical protein
MSLTDSSAAALQALAFLATIALVALSVLVAIGFAIAGRAGRATILTTIAAAALGAYALTLVAVGVGSRERVLGPGETKVFCELDCHLAYTVSRVRVVPAIDGRRARGAYYLVTLRTHFDERTIAPWRGDAPLWPNPRRLRLVDSVGRAWTPDAAAQRALAEMSAAGTPVETPLRPGETYETTVAFDVPPDVVGARLEVTDADPVTRFMIGHENSPFHRKTLFALGRGFATGR